jgi:hypothetical protein
VPNRPSCRGRSPSCAVRLRPRALSRSRAQAPPECPLLVAAMNWSSARRRSGPAPFPKQRSCTCRFGMRRIRRACLPGAPASVDDRRPSALSCTAGCITPTEGLRGVGMMPIRQAGGAIAPCWRRQRGVSSLRAEAVPHRPLRGLSLGAASLPASHGIMGGEPDGCGGSDFGRPTRRRAAAQTCLEAGRCRSPCMDGSP